MEEEKKCMSRCNCPCGMVGQYIKNNKPFEILYDMSQLPNVKLTENLVILFRLFLFLVVISLFVKYFFNI